MYGPNNKEIDSYRATTLEVIKNMTSEELSYTLGRYCGPYNIHLALKKYNTIIIRGLVEEALKNRLFEEEVLGVTN